MTLLVHPAITDDPGTGQGGTAIDKAWMDALDVLINVLVHSTTNTGITPADIIDEVKAARGSMTDLDTRFDVEHNENGSHKAIIQAGILQNLLADSLFANWAGGDAVAPHDWTLGGAGGTIVRCGAGAGAGEAAPPADGTKMAWGDFCAKITCAAAAVNLSRTVIDAADFPTGLRGKKATFAIRCKTSVGNQARCQISDGVGYTNSVVHPGDGVEGWIYVTHTFDAAATQFALALYVSVAGAAYFGAGVLVQGEWTPDLWFSEPVDVISLVDYTKGNASVEAVVNDRVLQPPAAGILREFMIYSNGGPTVDALIYAPKDASGVIYATPPQVDAGAVTNHSAWGGDRPDGTYARRCAVKQDAFFTQCTQVGGGDPGSNVELRMIFECPRGVMDSLVL